MQHLKNDMLTIDCNYIKNSTILKMEENTYGGKHFYVSSH